MAVLWFSFDFQRNWCVLRDKNLPLTPHPFRFGNANANIFFVSTFSFSSPPQTQNDKLYSTHDEKKLFLFLLLIFVKNVKNL